MARRVRDSALSRQDAWGWSMFAIVGVLSAFILVLPIIIFWLSVREGRPIDPEAAYSFVHYVEVFSDSFSFEVLANTLGFSTVALLVALVFGIPTAWLA